MHELARQYDATASPGESPRARHMTLLEAYYHGSQYKGLPRAWHEDVDTVGNPVPFRQRRPSTVLPLPRLIVNVFRRALWGAGRRPKATLAAGAPEDNTFIDDVIAEAKLYRVMSEATRRAFIAGTGLVVWRLDQGRLRADAWDASRVQPTFKPGAFPDLAAVDYRYKLTREVRDASTGHVKPVTYWHRETIDDKTWSVFEDVEVNASEPTWKASQSVLHGLPSVPAVWFTIGERSECGDFDGTGLFAPFLGLLDELNYTASQMGRALYYNLDPQTVLTGVAEGSIGALHKGGRNTWMLPEKADAKLLESNGSYVEQSFGRVDLLKKQLFDAAGVVLPDPDRVAGAQSGASLELLAAPQIARVDELRDDVGDAFIRLLEQILGALTSPGLAPDKVKIDVRDGKPRGKAAPLGRVTLSWGTHFPLTAVDAQAAADAVTKATSASVLSRAAGARYLARYFGVEDVEADQKLVDGDEARQDKRMVSYESRRAVADHVRFAGDDPDEIEGAEDAR